MSVIVRAARTAGRRGTGPLRLACAVALLCWAPLAAAQSCRFTGQSTDLVFTGYTPFGTGVAATATLAYRCPPPVGQAWISISAPRVMTAGSESLSFEVRPDAGAGAEWPAAPPLSVPVSTSGSVTVYGFLPPQDAAAGSYAGTLTLSIYTDAIGNQTDTTALAVTTVVLDSCVIDPGTLAFGSYDPSGPAPRDAVGSISVACTRGTAYDVGLGAGSFAAGTTRQMALGAQRLQYELYADPGRSTAWTTSTPVSGAVPSTARVVLPVYGRIPPGQGVGAGPYADTVQSTINF